GARVVSRRMFVQGEGAAQSWAADATGLRAGRGAQRAPTNGPDGNLARGKIGRAQPHTRGPASMDSARGESRGVTRVARSSSQCPGLGHARVVLSATLAPRQATRSG